jgi:hypothetical protein
VDIIALGVVAIAARHGHPATLSVATLSTEAAKITWLVLHLSLRARLVNCNAVNDRNGLLPRPPIEHAPRVVVTGPPTLLQRCVAKIDITQRILSIESGGLDLNNVNQALRIMSNEGVLAQLLALLLWKRLNQSTDHVAQAV